MNLPLSLTPKQVKIGGLVLLALALLYYVVVMRPALPWAYYVLAKERYKTFDAAFIRAWAHAQQAKEATFQYQNKFYLTLTGTVQK